MAAEEDDDDPLRVTDHHLHGALTELRHAGAELIQILLGAQPAKSLDLILENPDEDD